MPDVDAGVLSADEARSLRGRLTTARVGLVLNFVVAVVLLFAVGFEWHYLWLALCVPGAIVCLVLWVRAWRCPRCGGAVWDKNDPSADPGPALFGRLLPDRCAACGVRLIARAGEPES